MKIKLAVLVPFCALGMGACHLVDQRDFDARAGRKPEPPVAKSAPVKAGPGALLRIGYDTPDPFYAPALADAVRRAITLKPGVLFTVQTTVPLAATPEAQAVALEDAAKTGREVAEAMVVDGADQGQIEMAVRGDASVKFKEVQIFVH